MQGLETLHIQQREVVLICEKYRYAHNHQLGLIDDMKYLYQRQPSRINVATTTNSIVTVRKCIFKSDEARLKSDAVMRETLQNSIRFWGRLASFTRPTHHSKRLCVDQAQAVYVPPAIVFSLLLTTLISSHFMSVLMANRCLAATLHDWFCFLRWALTQLQCPRVRWFLKFSFHL